MVFAGCGINFYQAQKYKIFLIRANFRGIFLHFLFIWQNSKKNTPNLRYLQVWRVFIIWLLDN